jgi:hypothetical protein
MFDEWIDRQRRFGVPADEAVVCMHDPLALLALVGEPGMRVEQRPLAVERDGRLVERAGARTQTIVVDADIDASIERIVALLERACR